MDPTYMSNRTVGKDARPQGHMHLSLFECGRHRDARLHSILTRRHGLQDKNFDRPAMLVRRLVISPASARLDLVS